MIVLKGTAAIIRVTTSSAADIDVEVDYVKHDWTTPGAATELFRSDSKTTKIITATDTTITDAPTATIDHNIKRINLKNIDGALSNTLTVSKSKNGTDFAEMHKFVLAAGEWATIDENGVLFVSNSDGSVKVAGLLAGSLLGEYLHTDSSNHTTGPYTRTIEFILVGGGGGGAGVAANNNNMAASGGGSAGGYTRHICSVSPSTAYAYVAGVGGAGAANNAVGANGGNSTVTVGANTWTAQGGVGGQNMANGATNLQTTAATVTPSNTANSPLVSMGGQAGGQGWRVNGMVGMSGDGGVSLLGGGGRGVRSSINSNGQTVGAIGSNYGGGGAGALGTNGNANGGQGGNGCVLVREYT